MRLSSPARRRRRLPWWRSSTTTAMSAVNCICCGSPARRGEAAIELGVEHRPERRRRGDHRRHRRRATHSGTLRRRRSIRRRPQAPRPAHHRQHTEGGGDALAAAETQPRREHVAEHGCRAGDDLDVRPPHIARPAPRRRPFPASPARVARARPRRPLRRTLVAPMLPEPMRPRVLGAGEAREQRAEGMEPRRKPSNPAA